MTKDRHSLNGWTKWVVAFLAAAMMSMVGAWAAGVSTQLREHKHPRLELMIQWIYDDLGGPELKHEP